METTPAMTCALCNGPVVVNSCPNFGRYVALNCDSCGQYVVSRAAAERIRSLPAEVKSNYRSVISVADEDKILLIIVEPVGAGAGLKSELVLRNTLSL
jgi:hypothetical protein